MSPSGTTAPDLLQEEMLHAKLVLDGISQAESRVCSRLLSHALMVMACQLWLSRAGNEVLRMRFQDVHERSAKLPNPDLSDVKAT